MVIKGDVYLNFERIGYKEIELGRGQYMLVPSHKKYFFKEVPPSNETFILSLIYKDPKTYMEKKSFLRKVPRDVTNEVHENIIKTPVLRIERITSCGHRSEFDF